MTKTKTLFICLLSAFISSGAFAENSLPQGYRKVQLGMSVEQVKDALKKDVQFGYRGDRDVSLLPGEQRIIIETDTSRTAPYSFLDKCYFQFFDDKLYSITINMKMDKVDHYSIFSTLSEKYGKPSRLNPELTEWKDENVIMTLERPLTIKYLDRGIFEQMQNESLVRKSAEEMSRQQFLDSL